MKKIIQGLVTVLAVCLSSMVYGQEMTPSYEIGTLLSDVKKGEDAKSIVKEYRNDDEIVLLFNEESIPISKKKKDGLIEVEHRYYFRESYLVRSSIAFTFSEVTDSTTYNELVKPQIQNIAKKAFEEYGLPSTLGGIPSFDQIPIWEENRESFDFLKWYYYDISVFTTLIRSEDKIILNFDSQIETKNHPIYKEIVNAELHRFFSLKKDYSIQQVKQIIDPMTSGEYEFDEEKEFMYVYTRIAINKGAYFLFTFEEGKLVYASYTPLERSNESADFYDKNMANYDALARHMTSSYGLPIYQKSFRLFDDSIEDGKTNSLLVWQVGLNKNAKLYQDKGEEGISTIIEIDFIEERKTQ